MAKFARSPLTKFIRVRVTEEQDADLRAAAERKGITQSELVLQALDMWFEREEPNSSRRRRARAE